VDQIAGQRHRAGGRRWLSVNAPEAGAILMPLAQKLGNEPRVKSYDSVAFEVVLIHQP
jgi:hypothetical protein